MVNTYSRSVNPIGDETTWDIPREVKELIVLPPEGRTKVGRPKKRRLRVGWETKVKNKCSRCKTFSHNRKTWRNKPQIN